MTKPVNTKSHKRQESAALALANVEAEIAALPPVASMTLDQFASVGNLVEKRNQLKAELGQADADVQAFEDLFNKCSVHADNAMGLCEQRLTAADNLVAATVAFAAAINTLRSIDENLRQSVVQATAIARIDGPYDASTLTSFAGTQDAAKAIRDLLVSAGVSNLLESIFQGIQTFTGATPVDVVKADTKQLGKRLTEMLTASRRKRSPEYIALLKMKEEVSARIDLLRNKVPHEKLSREYNELAAADDGMRKLLLNGVI